MKYHVNQKTGRAGQCKATKKGCPLGEGTPHFKTKAEAQSHIEKTSRESNKTFKKIKKNDDNSIFTNRLNDYPNGNLMEIGELGKGRSEAMNSIKKYMNTIDLNKKNDVEKLRNELYKESRRCRDGIFKGMKENSENAMSYYLGRDQVITHALNSLNEIFPKSTN